MRPDLKRKADHLAGLIRKHGGWVDENDSDIVRFPTPHAMSQFLKAIETEKDHDT